jgi:hypothetical protein
VDRWSLWNEPNLPSWLQPQFAKDGTDIGADAYRALAQAGIRALRATGHAHDTILLGETAPVGRTLGPPATRPAAPVTFLRRLFCLDGGHCPRLRVSGYAHHPYTQGAHAAPFSPTAPGQISFTNAAVLKRLLRDGARAGAIPPRLPIWWTEFGYQTSPPDPVLGVPLAAQAEFLNFFDFLAARDPRVRAVSQYELVDDDARDGFQTGLRRFGSLAVKPAYGAYRLPLWVERRKRTVRVYGQLRPAPAGSRQTVVLQRSAAPGKPWLHAARFGVATRTHQFLHDVPYRRGVWRLKWGGFYSRAAVAHVP